MSLPWKQASSNHKIVHWQNGSCYYIYTEIPPNLHIFVNNFYNLLPFFLPFFLLPFVVAYDCLVPFLHNTFLSPVLLSGVLERRLPYWRCHWSGRCQKIVMQFFNIEFFLLSIIAFVLSVTVGWGFMHFFIKEKIDTYIDFKSRLRTTNSNWHKGCLYEYEGKKVKHSVISHSIKHNIYFDPPWQQVSCQTLFVCVCVWGCRMRRYKYE